MITIRVLIIGTMTLSTVLLRLNLPTLLNMWVMIRTKMVATIIFVRYDQLQSLRYNKYGSSRLQRMVVVKAMAFVRIIVRLS